MYVVTGATGNTGSVVAKALLARGQKVRAIGRSADRLQPLAKLGAEPFEADITDADVLAGAFNGAQAVYAMVPPDFRTQDYMAHSEQGSDALASALERSGVKHAVALSSYGADKPDRTGPVVGLNHMEQKLGRIAGLNVLFLRAGYFMENTLSQVGIIQALGKAAGPLRPDLATPVIATRDIGAFAADALLKLNFNGKQARELLGHADLDYRQIASIIGKAINKPDLEYVQLPNEQVRAALQQLGMSGNVVDLLLEMSDSLNSGYMKAQEKRTPQNTTPTSFEAFVAEEFVPLYQGKSQAA